MKRGHIVPTACLLVLTIFAIANTAVANRVEHGWGTLREMMWADYRSPELLTDAEAEFLATHYAVLSLEKCTGQSSGLSSEEGVYETAKKLKTINPNVRVFFYWGVVMQGFQCSASAQKIFKEHPEYFLKDDNGNPVVEDSSPTLDYRQQAARDWWTSVPLSIGPNASDYIDGILADGAGHRYLTLANFTDPERQALCEGSDKLIYEMQQKFNATNGGMVLGNGISMYQNRYQPGPMLPEYNMGILKFIDGIESEHVAAFESRDHTTGKLNTTRVLKNLELIDQASMEGKSVMMNEWAGPVVAPMKWPKHTPNTTAEWQAALSQHFNFSAALFLTVASPTVFFEYILWYPITEGVAPCPTCIAPTGWYPQVNKEVGSPLGPRKISGTVITRSFEHIDISVDLDSEKAELNWKI